MKHSLDISCRLTHQFALGWSGIDDWLPLCEVKVSTPRRAFDDGENIEDRAVVTVSPEQLKRAERLARSVGMPVRRAIRLAVEDAFSPSCRCEHDCCGHYSSYARAYFVKPRELVVIRHSSPNV